MVVGRRHHHHRRHLLAATAVAMSLLLMRRGVLAFGGGSIVRRRCGLDISIQPRRCRSWAAVASSSSSSGHPHLCVWRAQPPPQPPRRLYAASSTGDEDEDNENEGDGGEAPAAAAAAAAAAGDGYSPPTRVPNAIRPGTVYFVAVPLGNLGDVTLRALDVLRGVDLIAAEDTRTANLLLKALGLGRKPTVSHHQHNLGGRVPDLVRRAKDEKASIAVVTDAGTPGISDPGNELAAACWDAGVPVVPVPGPCAAVAALSVAGLAGATEFVFYGFLPAKAGSARRAKVAEVAAQDKPCVLYESPNRVLRTLAELLAAGEEGDGGQEEEEQQQQQQRQVLCARELTKLHEELFRGTLREAIAHFGGGGGGSDVKEQRGKGKGKGKGKGDVAPPPVIRGEFTLVLGPRPKRAVGAEEVAAEVRAALRRCMGEEGLSASEAAKRVAREVGKAAGMGKSDVYRVALELKEEEGEGEGGGG